MRAARLLAPVLPVAALFVVLARSRSDAAPPRIPAPPGEAPSPRAPETPAPARLPAPPPAAAPDPRGSIRAPTPAPHPPSWAPGEEERHFKWLRATSAVPDLERELDELAGTLHEQCAAEIRRRVGAGDYEPIPKDEDGRYPVPPPRRGVVEFVSGGPDLGLVRVHVPAAAVPAAYETQRRIDWLHDLLEAR